MPYRLNRRILMTVRLVAALCAGSLIVGCTVIVNPTWPDRSNDLTVELKWSNPAVDLDLYLTYPGPEVTSINSGSVPPYQSIQDAYGPPFTAGNWGFFPEDGLQHRERVYRGFPQSTDGNASFERAGTRLQTIGVRDFPFEDGNLTLGDFTTRSSRQNALPTGPDYAWVGVMEVYVYGRTGQVSDAGNPTVTFYDSQNRKVASFLIAGDTSVKGASITRIPVFRTDDGRNYYQFLLDQRMVLTTGDIRSIATGTETNALFGITGIDRTRSN